jgi:hypothetical protein
MSWRKTMRHEILIAGVAALAISAPALAESPTLLHHGFATYPEAAPATQPTTEVAQSQVPAYPPAATTTVVVAPTAPPASQAETPPPAPAPNYVWEPGHWSWNGMQYIWQPGKYIERPTVSATFVSGHWEQHPNGWVWVQGHWDYPGVGSSSPALGYPRAR